jgi:hypothetical protein
VGTCPEIYSDTKDLSGNERDWISWVAFLLVKRRKNDGIRLRRFSRLSRTLGVGVG